MLQKLTDHVVDLARQRATRMPRQADGLRAAIIPPAMPGSVGDAAMVSATAQHLRNLGFTRVDLFHGSDWPLDAAIDQRIGAERYFYGGSSLRLAQLLGYLPRYSHVFMLGADVIDGAYNPGSVRRRLQILAEASRLGAQCTILGSSYNNAPEASTRAALRALPATVTICGRDPLSHARFSQHLERPIQQTADVAFLLQARPEHADVQAIQPWIQAQRAEGRRLLAVNANYLHAAKVPGLRGGLSTLLGKLLEAPVSIVLLSHDSRTSEPDEKVLADAVASLPPQQRAHTRMLASASPGAVMAVLGQVDLLVTGRMHAMILALGSHTPAFGFAYQNKFEGLLSLLGLEADALLSSPEELAQSPEQVAARVLQLLDRADSLRPQIAQALPAVLALSRANFQPHPAPSPETSRAAA
jgi:polysaccharide pyruvyl transferase WcaK-like protein